MTFARKLRWLRERTGKSQKDLAEALQRYQSRVSKWEQESGQPTPEDLLVISRYFGVSLQYLCDSEIENPEDANPEKEFLAGRTEEERFCWIAIKQIGPKTSLSLLLAGPKTQPEPVTTREPVGPAAELPHPKRPAPPKQRVRTKK